MGDLRVKDFPLLEEARPALGCAGLAFFGIAVGDESTDGTDIADFLGN